VSFGFLGFTRVFFRSCFFFFFLLVTVLFQLHLYVRSLIGIMFYDKMYIKDLTYLTNILYIFSSH